MQPGIVVFACGNRSRGDDAIGPLLLERLASWLAAAGRSSEFALIDDYQLQIEHALDLQGRRLALFIDAGWQTPAPLVFYAAAAAPVPTRGNTHSLSPQGVLEVYRQVTLSAPPPSFVLCVRGEQFELGAGLSEAAGVNLEAAWGRLQLLCTQAEAARWRALLTPGAD
ncbi:MAG: hydrogenase maturation protease [Burkholderiales bacterium]|nr:hydrogenase maturation protease [Burkholderiales bacterium]